MINGEVDRETELRLLRPIAVAASRHVNYILTDRNQDATSRETAEALFKLINAWKEAMKKKEMK